MKEIKRLARCEKGHFYDAGKYNVCPHCENTREIPMTQLEKSWEPQPNTPNVRTSRNTTPPVREPVREPVQQKDPDPVRQEPPAVSQAPASQQPPVEQEDHLTVQFYQKTLGTEPVVGWLVCTCGVHFGQDFRIKSGRNFVGRSGAMDICLSGDTAVSRDRHLIVTYDPRGNAFFAQPGDTSSALSYLNDKPLLEATALKTGDKLTVGESELMFVAFCGENFTW